jgi:flagellar biosynthesis component FlhA
MSVCCEANSNRAYDRSGFCDLQHNNSGSRIVNRNAFLFVAAVIAIMTGFLFPLSAPLLDIFLTFSICLTVATLIITFSAKQALQVQGFPLLIVLVTILRIALGIASTKLMFSQSDAGTVINFFGSIIIRNNPTTPGTTTFFFGMFSVFVFAVIFKAARGIKLSASEFTGNIVPARQILINSDSNAGVISSEQADRLREKIICEASFFIAMSGTARFIVCAAVIELLIICVNTVASMAVGVMSRTTTSIPIESYAILTLGVGTLIQASALFAALASGYLVRKSLAHSSGNNETTESKYNTTKRVKVVSSEVLSPQEPQPQYYKPKEHVESIKYITSEKTITKEAEWFAEEISDEQQNLYLWDWQKIKDMYGYKVITELIDDQLKQKKSQAKTILMAAESFEELGVTVPVNIAIRMAQKGRKCLLIDFDQQRNAISKVFDIDSNNTQINAISTCIKNLWIQPICNYREGEKTTLKAVISNQQAQYDCLVVYVPNIKALADSDNLATYVKIAMFFSSKGKPKSPAIENLHKILTDNGCEIFKPKYTLAETAQA